MTPGLYFRPNAYIIFLESWTVKPEPSHVYRFEVSLQEVEPPVWRAIQVPGDYSFWDLHVAIQDAMGWLDYHLHEFEIINPATGNVERIGIPDEDFLDEEQTLAGWEVKISDYFSPENATASYTYDFGDGWVHTVTVKEVVERDPDSSYPRCAGGQRACPPEDCGGPWGYQEFLEAIRNADHEEHHRMLEWAGGSFDAEAFDPGGVSFDDPAERWKLAFRD